MADQKSRKQKELGLTGYIIRPMWITFKQMVKSTIHRPNCILYPWEKQEMPPGYRGRPGLIWEKCIACSICVRVCPTRCLDLVEVDDIKEPGKKVKRPRLNLGRCMMCGYCAEYCPTKSMIITPEYELAEYTREAMIYDPVKLQYAGDVNTEIHIIEVLPSELKKGGQSRDATLNKEAPILEDKKCISCTKCAKVCPTEAIVMKEAGVNEKGRPVKKPVIDKEKCVACENCVIECPKDALTMEEVR
jgi:NADH-quinone oxidoreductase subunit I